MDDPNKKVNQEATEANKDENYQITDAEAEKAVGGASFEKFDFENKKPK